MLQCNLCSAVQRGVVDIVAVAVVVVVVVVVMQLV